MRSLPLRLRRTLCAALLGLLPGVAAHAQGGGVPVTTDPVRVGPVPIEILANGIVASESVITVRARVDGQIEQVLVEEGQLVKKGQPLFIQDSRFNRALLAQFEANLIKDRALLTRYTADLLRYPAAGP